MKDWIVEISPYGVFSTSDGVTISNPTGEMIRITIDKPPYSKEDYCKKCGVLIRLRK